MKRWLVLLIAGTAATGFAAEELLPEGDDTNLLEIEPPLLPQNASSDRALRDIEAGGTAAGDIDIARLEADLERAKKNAANGERLYKSGILAKVEAEERALKVVRLEAKLAEAQLQEAKRKLDEAKGQSTDDGTLARELKAADALVAEAADAAQRAADERRRAEVEAAARNVERQQRLLSLGSGRKADLSRAQEKLAELQTAAK
jgi:hypothetical protein